MFYRNLLTDKNQRDRRRLALKSRELTAELGLLSLKVQKAEASNREGATSAREEEEQVLKEHHVRAHRAPSTYIDIFKAMTSPLQLLRTHEFAEQQITA